MLRVTFSLVISLVLLYAPYVEASTDEFKSCRKMAVYELRQCLTQNPHNENKHCWVKSEQIYDNCSLGVKRRYKAQNKSKGKSTQSHKQTMADRKLDKKLRMEKIKVRLMAAANLQVYQSILDEVISGLNKKQSSDQLTGKQLQSVMDREVAYGHFLTLVEKQVNCDNMREQIIEAFAPKQPKVRDSALPHEVREIIKHVRSYCRVSS